MMLSAIGCRRFIGMTRALWRRIFNSNYEIPVCSLLTKLGQLKIMALIITLPLPEINTLLDVKLKSGKRYVGRLWETNMADNKFQLCEFVEISGEESPMKWFKHPDNRVPTNVSIQGYDVLSVNEISIDKVQEGTSTSFPPELTSETPVFIESNDGSLYTGIISLSVDDNVVLIGAKRLKIVSNQNLATITRKERNITIKKSNIIRSIPLIWEDC